MSTLKYVFGPVPSRRLGRSLGVSPIIKKACNYSCIYCQLGRTDKMTNTRKPFFKVEDILNEFKEYLQDDDIFDVISIVGEGEPTLYSELGELIRGLKSLTDKPVAVITNSALMGDESVRKDLMEADIVLPSLDSYDEESWHKIDRPHGKLIYQEVLNGLVKFTKEFKGQIFMELMLMDGINDSNECLDKFKELFSKLDYDKLYINTPVRPPAEDYAIVSSKERINYACELLGGISIDALASGGFFSEIEDDYEAILSIIARHPMNQYEISGFLDSRTVQNKEDLFERLNNDNKVNPTEYKGYITYRLK